MKLYGAGQATSAKIYDQVNRTVSGKTTQRMDGGQASDTARLTALYINKGLEIPFSRLSELAAELAQIGVPPSEIDSDSAMRALFLRQHNIPLDPDLISLAGEKGLSLLERLAGLRDRVVTVYRDNSAPVELRTAIEVFLRDTAALLQGSTPLETLHFSLERIVENWLFALETDVRRFAEGKGGSSVLSGSSSIDELQSTLLGELQSRFDESDIFYAGDQIKKVREEISALLARFSASVSDKENTRTALQALMTELRSRLSMITGEMKTAIERGNPGIMVGMPNGFFEERLRELEKKLGLEFDYGAYDVLLPREDSFPGNAPGFRELLYRSGMAFEWRLLAWYRSGKDPAYLQRLMHGDLKGVLMNLSDSLQRQRTGRGTSRLVKRCENETHSVIDMITKRQLAVLMHKTRDDQSLIMEIPPGETHDHDRAYIRVRGRKKPGSITIDPRYLSLSLSVVMSRLGAVDVSMSLAGERVKIHFVMENDKSLALAREMSDEIRNAMKARGLFTGEVTFSLKGMTSAAPDKKDKPGAKLNLDITG